jgi:hypothetical protein
MSHKKIANSDWRDVEERFQKKQSSWKGKVLSVGGRMELINIVLSSLPMYLMSFSGFLRVCVKNWTIIGQVCFWQSDEHKKKYRLAKWSILNKPSCVGGLGILDLDVQNICLLSKWLYKLLNENGVWQSMIKKKYLQNKPLSQVN